MKNLRFNLLTLGASVIAQTSFSTAALAQETSSEAASDSEEAAATEIVITAQRRSQRLQDVPVAVTAASAEDLAKAHVENIADIQSITPSVKVVTSYAASQGTNIQIRGLGTAGLSRSFEGAVGVFIDGVYRSRAGQALQNFLDVDTVQILRGPQGTLFGKNTSAGAFLLTSKAPRIGEFGGSFEGGYGNYDAGLVKASVNIPLSDNAAARVAGLWSRQDGYTHNSTDGHRYGNQESGAIKGQLLVKPSDGFDIRLIVDWSRSHGNCCVGGLAVVTPSVFSGLTDSLALAHGFKLPSANPFDRQVLQNRDSYERVVDRGVTAQMDWDLPFGGTLHSVTSYRKWTLTQLHEDIDLSGADIFNIDERFSTKQFTQEFVYNGKIGENSLFRSVNYVVGAYFADERLLDDKIGYNGTDAQAFYDVFFNALAGLPAGFTDATPGPFYRAVMKGRSKSYAAFTHWDFSLTDRVSLALGARFSREEKRGSLAFSFVNFGNAVSGFNPFFAIGLVPGPSFDVPTRNDAASGTASLSYKFTKDVMAYASYNRGFKAGGLNLDETGAGLVANNPVLSPGGQPLDPRYRPEKVDAFEVGIKSSYLGRRARTNIAFFYNRIKDLQVAQFSGLHFIVLNAPKAETYGAEIENSFELTSGITLQLDGIYLPKANFGQSTLLGAPLSGRRFAQAAKFAGNAVLNLEHEVTQNLALTGRIGVSYEGRIYTNTANNAQQEEKALLNLSIGAKSLRDDWSVEFWCQNCTNKDYFTQHIDQPLQPGGLTAFLGAPRTFGATLRGNF